MFSICHTRWLPYKSLGAWSSPKFYRSNVTRVFNFVLDSIFFFLFLFNLILIPSVFDYSMFKSKILFYFNLRDLIHANYVSRNFLFYDNIASWTFLRNLKKNFLRIRFSFYQYAQLFWISFHFSLTFYYILFVEKIFRDFWQV